MRKVLFPGSFDPITNGHMDVIKQALGIYDKVIVAVLVNSSKPKGMFTIEERKRLIQEIYKNEPRVEVISTDENIAAVDIALQNGCTSLIRGLRNLTDFAEELENQRLNLYISDDKVNTVALFANAKNISVSSSMVKELFRLKKDISGFVHPTIYNAIKNKIGRVKDEN